MIGIVSGTNRADNLSCQIANLYAQLLENEGAEHVLIDLRDLPRDIAFAETYGERSADYTRQFVQPMEDCEKFVFVIPEYNGGFPGILKLFIDSIPPRAFYYKKAGLIGLSNGRGGAARAMDQFSNVLNYLRVDVIAQKPKLSAIHQALGKEGDLMDEEYATRLKEHVKKMLAF
ncbi:MAG: NAD(P)H-dependent oxidoreductase [Flavobacteriales bacterium]|nr:NAD(P)H-dependent oxidoreductase [Flavobacteriales bacterium]